MRISSLKYNSPQFIWVGILFALLAAGVVYISTVLEQASILGLLILTLLLLPFWFQIFARRIDLFEPIGFITLLFTLSYILVPVLHLASERFILTRIVDYRTLNSLVPGTLIWASIAWACLVVGYKLPYGDQLSRLIPQFPEINIRYLPRLCFFFISLGFLGAILNVLLIINRGGFTSLLDPTIGRSQVLQGVGYLVFINRLTIVGVITYSVYYYWNRGKGYKEGSFWVLGFVVLLHWVANFLFLSRSQLLWTLIFVFIIRHFLYRRSSLWVIIALPILPFIFNVLAYFFQYTLPSLFHITSIAADQSIIAYSFDRYIYFWIADFGRFEVDMIVFSKIPKEVNFYLGQTYSVFFTYPIPRSLMPGKLSFSNFFGDIVTRTHAPSQLSELYMNFSYPGIMVGFIIFGVIYKTFGYIRVRDGETISFYLIYPMLISFMMILTTGSFAYGLLYVSTIFLPMVLIIFVAKKRKSASLLGG